MLIKFFKEITIYSVTKFILLASIAAYFKEITNYLWSNFINFGIYIKAGYVDGIYKDAALNNSNYFNSGIFFAVTIIYFFIPVILDLFKFTNEECLKNMHPLMRKMSVYKLVRNTSLLSYVIAILFAYNLMKILNISDITGSFNQRLTVMAPWINEQEYKQIKAQWAMMNGLNDYITITNSMEKRASELNLQLPKLQEKAKIL